MAPSLVQVASNAASASSVTVTLGSPTTPGNTLVVLFGDSADATNNAPSGITLGASADNWAQLAVQGTSGDHAIAAGWADPDCAGGQTSVVISTGGSSADHLFAWVFEWEDLSGTLDVESGGANSFSGTWTSGATGATAQASEVAFGITAGAVNGSAGTGAGLAGPGSPWTNEAQQSLIGSSHTKAAICGYQILSSTGAQTYSGTSSPSTTNDTLVFTLLASGGGPSYSGTGDAAVSLAVSASGSSARAGGGSAAVALGASASGASARAGSGSAALSLHALATGSSHRSGTGIAHVSLAALGTAPAPAAQKQTGSWWGLDTVLKESRAEFDAYWSRPPLDCPICTQPLSPAPSSWAGSGVELYCEYAGDHQYHYPRDFRRAVRHDNGGLVSPL